MRRVLKVWDLNLLTGDLSNWKINRDNIHFVYSNYSLVINAFLFRTLNFDYGIHLNENGIP